MNRLQRISLLIAFALPVFIQCQNTYEFSDENSARILKTLSSDEMKGRHAFSPEIEMAADFISNEFSEIGLQPLNGDTDYRQSFELYSIGVDEASISVNGRTVGSNDFFAMVNAEPISWTSADDVTTHQIKRGEDFRAKFNEFRNGTEDALVLVHNSQEENFRRYQSFFSRASRTFPDKQSPNVVFVLSNASASTNFGINITKKVDVIEMANVAGMIEGNRTDEYVLFSAHYDHIGVRTPQEAGADSIANGANDNASGVTAVIELARYFASMGKPERSLLFVGFTAEESGGYGSKYFSEQLNPDEIMAMFNIEMIGKPAVSGPNSAWITGFERSSFGELLQKSTEGTIYEFYPDPYPAQNLFYRSDNATLARLGVPAHSISTTPIDVDPDYHEVSDEFETIDISHMTNTIRAISRAAEGIISGDDTPTRVDVSKVN